LLIFKSKLAKHSQTQKTIKADEIAEATLFPIENGSVAKFASARRPSIEAVHATTPKIPSMNAAAVDHLFPWSTATCPFRIIASASYPSIVRLAESKVLNPSPYRTRRLIPR
jgi:hypothetical protein